MNFELTVTEQNQLESYEAVIERGLHTFVEVGNALAAIRDGELYKKTHRSFEDYCRDRWGIERVRAYQLMEAAGVVKNFIQNPPLVESHARPLARLEPDEQIAAWQEVVETAPNGKVTAAHVAEVVERRNGATPGDSMAVHYSSRTDEWETPLDLFDALDREFGFTLDVCALPDNAKCPKYFTPKDNGLIQDWNRRGEVCWMNPPYGDEIKAWVRKAAETAAEGGTVVTLLPARVDTAWWWDYCRFGEVRFLRGRLRFGGGDNGAPFPSAVVIFRPQDEPRVVWWEGWK